MAFDLFSVEQLLDMEEELEDEEALIMYEKQLTMSCINNASVDSSSSSSDGCCPVLTSGAEPWTKPVFTTSITHDPEKCYSSGTRWSLKRPFQVITFGYGSSSENTDFEEFYEVRDNNWSDSGAAVAAAPPKRRASYAQEHVVVERRRREKLAQRFAQLTAVIPGLNNTRMDKASIIEEASKHIIQLQERVKVLEQEVTSILGDYGSSSSLDDYNVISSLSSVNEQRRPLEVDVKVSHDKDKIKIRIHSKLDYNLISKIHHEMEKIHLSLLNSNVTSFGKYAMETTLVVKMEDEFCMTMEQVVEHIRGCFHES